MTARLKPYYTLVKPGVLFGNVLTTFAGFLLASKGFINPLLLLATILGSTLVIASACVLNNVLDADIDSKMERTKNRPTVTGSVKKIPAIIYSVVLGLLGLLVLLKYTNLLVVLVGIVGFVDYVLLYGVLSKRMSWHGTLVGSISGAMPILAGYVAATNRIDLGAVLVFLVLFFWQMPEFYSISIYRHDEYKKAGVPVISIKKGIKTTKQHILFYTIAFVIATLLLTYYSYTGIIYFIVMAICGGYWIKLGIHGQHAIDDAIWARKMFRFSLIILLVFCALLSISFLLP